MNRFVVGLGLGLAFVSVVALAQAPVNPVIVRSLQGSQDPTGAVGLDANGNVYTRQIAAGGYVYGTPFGVYKNLLDNGAMLIQQRGTGTATAATTAGCAITSYAADRWCMDVNVTSGAGQLTPITSTPTPPVGFTQALKAVRNSGVLTQPQCVWQEVNSSRVIPLAQANQSVMFSAWVAALAGLNADNGNVGTLVIITGTGTDEGLGALRSAVGMTASPAITPAWTGVATLLTQNIALTTTFARFNTTPVPVPTTVTEMAVGVCFTPTATGAGATDGLAFTGAQLEVVPVGASQPSAFEVKPDFAELYAAQRKFWQQTEANTTIATCNLTGANAVSCPLPNPVPMEVAPTATITAGGYQLDTDGTAGAVSGQTGGTGTVNICMFNMTNTTTAAAHALGLRGSGTTGKTTCSADF